SSGSVSRYCMMPSRACSVGSTTRTRLVPIASGWPGHSPAWAGTVKPKTNRKLNRGPTRIPDNLPIRVPQVEHVPRPRNRPAYAGTPGSGRSGAPTHHWLAEGCINGPTSFDFADTFGSGCAVLASLAADLRSPLWRNPSSGRHHVHDPVSP